MELSLNLSALPAGPFGLAFSGGGDSTALLHTLRARRPHVLIVDHGLRAGSGREAAAAKRFAIDLGLTADILRWQILSPVKTAIQARARRARYGLMGARCRELGLTALITGHTQDDQAETSYMRLSSGGSWRGAAAMASITSDVLWPELYGISLRRPMLEVSRAQIRQYLKVHDLSFVDDPSNEDINFSRVRARRILARDPRLRGEMLALGADLRAGRAAEMKYLAAQLGAGVIVDGFGCIHLRARVAPYLLARLLRAVSGGRVLADQAALERLSCAMGAADFKGATLGGAMIKPAPAGATNPAINCKFVLSRDPSMALGRVGRPALGPITTPASQSLWDGRFVVHGGANVQPAAGHLGKLSQQLKKQLKACPSQARPTLPLIKDGTEILAIGPINAGKDEGSCMQTAVHMRLSREFADTEIKFMRTVHY